VDHASSSNQGGGGETDLRDGLATSYGKFGKAHAAERVESASLNIELISESHGKSTHL